MATPPPANSESTKVEINRPLVGVIALVCVVTSVVLEFLPDANEMWVAGFRRAGLMTGAFWLALPTKNRPAAWANVSPRTLIGVVGAIIALAARPKLVLAYLPILIPLAIVGFLLKRRSAKRPGRDSWK